MAWCLVPSYFIHFSLAIIKYHFIFSFPVFLFFQRLLFANGFFFVGVVVVRMIIKAKTRDYYLRWTRIICSRHCTDWHSKHFTFVWIFPHCYYCWVGVQKCGSLETPGTICAMHSFFKAEKKTNEKRRTFLTESLHQTPFLHHSYSFRCSSAICFSHWYTSSRGHGHSHSPPFVFAKCMICKEKNVFSSTLNTFAAD